MRYIYCPSQKKMPLTLFFKFIFCTMAGNKQNMKPVQNAQVSYLVHFLPICTINIMFLLFSDTIMVTRSCHNGTTNANGTSYAPRGCTELYKGESCYCLPGADGKPCNGQEQTIVSLLLQGFSLMLIISLGYFI